jgi:hypothetical protein
MGMLNAAGNPYMNPFLNPYMAQFPMSGSTATMYFMLSQSANGGIGSGQLSGVRPAASTSIARTTQARRTRQSELPGGGAARYFNRGPQPGGIASTHYNRVGSYYPNNSR